MSLSFRTFNRLERGMGSGAAATEIDQMFGQAVAPWGNQWYVDTVNGGDTNPGDSKDSAFASFTEAFTHIDSNDVIWAKGDIREQITAPLGIYGVKIIGAPSGRPRHSTEGGTVVDGNGVSWREESTAGDAPLLELRQQGWEVHNILMIPQSGYSAIKLHREETATYPDASHFIASGVKFISGGTRVGYGIEDYGGAYHIGVFGCEFYGLEFAYNPTNVSIAAPNAHIWERNTFSGNKHDIVMNALGCQFRRNFFLTPYDGTTHPNTLNLAYTADAGLATNKNVTFQNTFADAAADVTIAKGYKPGTGDIWRNWVTNTAADIVTVPS